MRRFAAARSLRRLGAAATTAAALAAVLSGGLTGAAHSYPATPAEPALYLVTLDGGAASSYHGSLDSAAYRDTLRVQQDLVLAAVDAPAPAYRWTSALNGFAVQLTPTQARDLVLVPGVDSVEHNAVRRVAAAPSSTSATTAVGAQRRGGAGVVIGVVDSGLDPDSPLFANVPGLGRALRGFHGGCEAAQDWPTNACTRKIVGARWFVAGFGAGNIRSTSSLSPRDDSGHGTLVASVAAGNSGVSVKVGAQSLGVYAGQAPQARVAVYKACWTAPDPDDDGCSTADLVTAVDRATADGVDVLNLSVAGGSLFDTVDKALLGATEGGVLVVAAAGNNGRVGYAAHAAPWVTTVGAVTGRIRGGTISLGHDGSLSGATSSHRTVTAPLVSASSIAAPGAGRDAARLCLSGSLDAGQAAGKIVICDRGGIGRVDKSRTVALADGVGMVLANIRGGNIHADFQQVPTLHLARAEAQSLRRWLRSHPGADVTMRPGPAVGGTPRVVRWSAPGDPRGDLVKPEVVAPGVDVLGAVPPSAESTARWSFLSGTSAATARVSGQAAVVLARHRDWSTARVRSALMTSARAVAGNPSSLRQGAGRTRVDTALHPGLVYDIATRDYRRYLSGQLDGRDLNLPSIKSDGPAVVLRTVTNVGPRAMYYSVRARGFTSHHVSVTPVAIRVGPGESRTYTVTISGPVRRQVDSGWITWRGANGIRVRIPVVISD